MIHILDRQTERILDVLVNQSDSKIYWDTKMTEAIEDNVLIFEFRMLADSPAAKHVVTKNKLTAQDQDGFHRLFIIDSVETSHDANGKILFVSALGDHIELASEEPIPPQTLNGQTAETAVQFVLANTRYQPGQIDFAGSRSITFDTYTDPLAALQKIASEFELELRFRVTVNPDGTITRIVDLLKPDDVFNGKEIVFGKDMTGILRKENTENICTRLIGIGPADEDGNIVTFASVNGGKIYVEDEEAFQRWNNAGRHIWGIFEYQPEEGTEVTPQQLLDATKKEMEKRKNSAVEWEVQAAALEQVIGLEHERVRVGMNVRIKDEAFDPPIYLEARVLETEMPELDDPNGNFSYTFGNYRQVTVIIPPEVKAIQKTLFRNANAWTAAKSIAAQALADAAKAQETADGKITSFYQPDPPVTASEGDLWFDTDDGNKPHIWQNGEWVNAQDSGIAEALNRANDAQATADKKVQTFFSETQPTAEGIGDLWYNPASGALFRWSGSAWELVSDVTGKNTAADTAKVNGKPAVQVIADITAAQQAVEEAKQTAQQAQTTADGKNSVFHSPTAPPTTGRKIGDVWFDTSRDNLMHRFNGVEWVEAKWGEQSIVANSITANHIKSLVGLNVNDQFIVDSNGNVKLANDTVTIDRLGIKVKEADFLTEDAQSGMVSKIVPMTNLIRDHSFELIKAGSLLSDGYFSVAESPVWYLQGSPRCTNPYPDGTDVAPIAPFGDQSILVNSSNYVIDRESSWYMAPGETYTLSAYFHRPIGYGVGTPQFRIRLFQYDGATGTEKVLYTSTSDFAPVPSNYSLVRYSHTFTLPSNFEWEFPTTWVDIEIKSTNSTWVAVDGVQLVRGTYPTAYDAEDSLWRVAKGYIDIDRTGLFWETLWTGGAYLTDTQTVTPSKPLSSCMTGWILRWQAYNVGEGIVQSDFQYTHIPKVTLQAGGRGHRFVLLRGNIMVNKYAYIYDDRLVGFVGNGQGDNRNLVLSGVFEY